MNHSKNIDSIEQENTGDASKNGSLPPKHSDPDDPMRVKVGLAEGDPHLMLDGLIEEYAAMGWDANQIAEIFESPFFLATHGLTQLFGPEVIHRRIEQILQECGVLHFDIVEQKPLESDGSAQRNQETLKGDSNHA